MCFTKHRDKYYKTHSDERHDSLLRLRKNYICTSMPSGVSKFGAVL